MTEMKTMPGGWTINPTAEMPAELETYLTKFKLGATIEPLTLMGTQLVNGVNYLVLCKIQLNTNPAITTLSKIVVHAPFSGEYAITYQEPLVNLSIPGGFELKFSFGSMPQSVATSFSELLSPLHGATYEPVAYIGNQVVKGLNHMVLAKQTLVVQRPEDHLVLIVVNESAPGSLESEFALVSIDRLV